MARGACDLPCAFPIHPFACLPIRPFACLYAHPSAYLPIYQPARLSTLSANLWHLDDELLPGELETLPEEQPVAQLFLGGARQRPALPAGSRRR